MDAPVGPLDARLRALPSIQRLLERAQARGLAIPRDALRHALDEIRAGLRADAVLCVPDDDAVLDLAAERTRPVLRRVINATGIILHTNLGRAPLAEAAVAAVTDAARGYSNLEYDLDSGHRGSRLQGAEPLLRELTGAEAALAVNNNAAAMLLALSGLAAGGEVIVSRGELVEIGGGFRIPDVIRQGGARLVEVGTTNKTRLADYRAAITPSTRVLLKVHQSNYRIIGFTAEASLAELAGLAREAGLMLVQDLGSGALIDLRALGRAAEPTVPASIAQGVDLVAFSGDKLLGGPQAGLLVGSEAAIAPLRRHPLMRALRLDKLSLAALEATLRLYRNGAAEALPVPRMLAQSESVLESRAAALCALVAGIAEASVVVSIGYAGGGTLPDQTIASRAVAVAVAGCGADELARRLRLGRPAVVGRIHEGRVLLDVLAIEDSELPLIAEALRP